MKREFSDKQRGVAGRKRKPVMFISLEGNNKTEKFYLNSLNKDQGVKFSLQFTPGHETNPKRMWTALHDSMKEVFSASDGDKAYCVCDRDYEAHKLERIREIKREASCDHAKIIVSNPCFELWFLNHFRYSTRAYGSTQDLISDLCDYIPCYKKNADYYQLHLKSRTTDALNHSKRQSEQVNIDQQSDDIVINNPGTEVAGIVQTLITG